MPLSDLGQKEIVFSAQFKPSIRSSSKIYFSPENTESDADSLPMRDYTYDFTFTPKKVEHYTRAATAASVGFRADSVLTRHVQYIKLGYGMHNTMDAALHLHILPSVKTMDVHLLAAYRQFKPNTQYYQYEYNADINLLTRFYIKDKYALSFHYLFDAMNVRTNYNLEGKDPFIIPSSRHKFYLGFDNLRNPIHTKWFVAPSFDIDFSSNEFPLIQRQQGDTNFTFQLPLVIVFNPTMRLNILTTYEHHTFSNINQEKPSASLRQLNYIGKASTNFQYLKDNINGYVGVVLYTSNTQQLTVYPELFAHVGFGKASPFFMEAKFNAKQFYQDLYSFRSINPWIVSDSVWGNTTHIFSQLAAQYNVKSRFNLRLSLEWNLLYDIKLINNNAKNDYQTFDVLHEKSLGELVLRNDYAYIQPGQYEIGLTLTTTMITGQESFKKPIGRFYPLAEIYGLYHLFSFMKVRASLLRYNSIFYIDKDNLIKETAGMFDINLYLEASLLKKKQLRLWVDMANLANQAYERWNNYKHPGFIATFGVSLYL